MRILLVHDEIKTKGGASIYVEEIVKTLKEEGHEVRLFAYDDLKNKKNNPLFFNLKLYKRLKMEIKKFQPEVIHINNTHKFQNSIYLACLKKNTVKTFHDYWAIYPFNGKENSLKNSIINFLGRIIERRLLKKLKIISPSKELAEKIKDLGLEAKHVDYFSRLKNMRGGKEEKSLLFVGYFHEVKGLKTLIGAFEKLLEKYQGYTLKLVGEGPEKIRKNKNIQIIEWKNEKELSKIYAESEIIIIPSRIPETGPLVLIEAMTFGIPILGSNVPGIREKIIKNRCGLLFEPDSVKELTEKIEALKNNKSLYKQLSENGLKFSGEYSKKKHLESLTKIYLRRD